MLPIVWLKSARLKLATIISDIAEESPQAARRLNARIQDSVLPTAEHPYIFRPGRVPGTREIIAHPNYVVVYRVTAENIQVINVMHARQQYP